jgi:autotransporter passenger strand-loop-strand repeat protein
VVSNGETLTVSSGQTSNGFDVLRSGTLIVAAGGTANGTVLSGGTQQVEVGGVAVTTQVYSGGSDQVFGSETGATVFASGTLIVESGGTADHLTISSGGVLDVQGTTLQQVVVFSGGTENVSSGGAIQGLVTSVVSSGVVSSVINPGVVISGGIVKVLSGGVADHVQVWSGGVLNMYGTLLSNSRVFSGGVENIESGGRLTGPNGSGIAVSGGTVNVLAGGVADHITLLSRGLLNVSGTILGDVTVLNGCTENISSGASPAARVSAVRLIPAHPLTGRSTCSRAARPRSWPCTTAACSTWRPAERRTTRTSQTAACCWTAAR